MAREKPIERIRRLDAKKRAVRYKGGECMECGLRTAHMSVYVFHHRDPDHKADDISALIRKSASWDIIKRELDKCDLLCHTCHSHTSKHSHTYAFKCPRCLNRNLKHFRRGTLTNDSSFLPRNERGRKRAVKVPVRCLYCGYKWRSTSGALDFIQEEPHGEEEKAHA